MKYKAVLFDLDDTLIQSSQVYDKALEHATKSLCREYDLDFDLFYEVVVKNHFIVRNNFPTVHTRHSRILVFRRALAELPKSYDIGILPEIEDIYWEYFLENVELYPDVIEMLKRIRESGIKTAIVSDGDLSLRIRKIRNAGLISLVDEIVCSEEVIFEKPFSAIFTLALSRLEVDPDQSLMVGNNYKNDVRGAQLVGMNAAIFDPSENGNPEGQNGSIKPDFVIHKYDPDLFVALGIA